MRTPFRSMRPRRGFTLIELLIAMTMLTVIGTAIVSVLNSQQRFVRSAADVGGLRTQMQTALSILPGDLRAVSPIDGDILAMSDSSIQVLATIGSSIVCTFAGNVVTLAPEETDPADPLRLTSLAMTPQAGDSVFIWDDGASGATNNDNWRSASTRAYGVSAVAVTDGACPAPYTSAGNADAPAYQLTIDGATTPLRASLVAGAPVRITRHVRYGLYQSAADSRWYLGYREPGIATYEFVAGPFRAYSADAAQPSGLRFQFWDTTGTAINVLGANITARAVTSTVGRVAITARAASNAPLSLGGASKGKYHYDSLRVGMTFRNRVP